MKRSASFVGAVWGVLFALLICVSPSGAYAQSEPGLTPPPILSRIDQNGVDLVSGEFHAPSPDLGIGGSGSGLTSVNLGRGPVGGTNFTGTINTSVVSGATYYLVSLGGSSEKFQFTGSAYIPVEGGSNSLTCVTNSYCLYTTKSGTVARFDYTGIVHYSVQSNWGMLSSITKSDGEIITIKYRTYNNYPIEPQPGGPAFLNLKYIRSVTSSLGWMIRYEPAAGNLSPVIVRALNTATDYCGPEDDTCSFSQTWPTLTEGSPRTNANGNYITFTRSTTNNSLFTSVVTQDGVTVNIYYHAPVNNVHRVSSIVKNGSTWTYAYVTNAGVLTTTVTAPNGTTRILVSNPSNSQVISQTDELGRVTKYTYDTAGRIRRVIFPDATYSGSVETGGYAQYSYDTRGNVTQTLTMPKGGGTVIVTSATYETGCANLKTCNKPLTLTDAHGAVTSYTYDATHGGVLTETLPAVNSVQAQVRYNYTQVTPQVKNAAGNLVPSTPVWRLTGTSACMSAHLNACVNTADEARTTTAYSSVNVLPISTTVKRGDGSLTQTTTITYDSRGNATVIDGPQPGTVDAIYTFYDILSRQTGVIGVDPDGAGPRPRLATRSVYTNDGLVAEEIRGTTTGVTYADLMALTPLEKDTNSFQAATGLPLVARYYTYEAGAYVLKNLSQLSYDNMFRVECEAQRLNPTAALPASACTLGTAGTDGNDRIVKYEYDAAGVMKKMTSAHGTALARSDYVKTFNATNGTLSFVTDAKGNKTSFEYDNFNRLVKTIYAQAANGTLSNTGDYEQINYTGTRVSSVRLRDSQTISFAYDTLSRVSSKSGALSESFSYNNFGQVLTHTNNTTGGAAATSTYGYNALGWLLTATQPQGTVTYEYDAYGRRTKLIYPGSFEVAYTYNTADELTYISAGGVAGLTFTYDNYGRRSGLNRSNGQNTSYGFDPASRLTGIGTTANSLSYGYTTIGQIKTRTHSNPAFAFNPSANSNTPYGIDGLNRISSVGGISPTYDARGNLTGDGGGTYVYNPNNLLTSATLSGVTASLSYDAENRLYSLTKNGVTTRFLYDGADLIAEYDGAGNLLRRYVHGPGDDEPLIWFEGTGIGAFCRPIMWGL